jgi:hypothetical protein
MEGGMEEDEDDDVDDVGSVQNPKRRPKYMLLKRALITTPNLYFGTINTTGRTKLLPLLTNPPLPTESSSPLESDFSTIASVSSSHPIS